MQHQQPTQSQEETQHWEGRAPLGLMTSEALEAHAKSSTGKLRVVIFPESGVSSRVSQSREQALLLKEGAHLGCMTSRILDWHVHSFAGRFTWCDVTALSDALKMHLPAVLLICTCCIAQSPSTLHGETAGHVLTQAIQSSAWLE